MLFNPNKKIVLNTFTRKLSYHKQSPQQKVYNYSLNRPTIVDLFLLTAHLYYLGQPLPQQCY